VWIRSQVSVSAWSSAVESTRCASSTSVRYGTIEALDVSNGLSAVETLWIRGSAVDKSLSGLILVERATGIEPV
jgi:hypothetical protein